MHPTIYSLLALDLANERVAEAERRSRFLNGAGPLPPSLPRRVLQWLAAKENASASFVRRLRMPAWPVV